MHAFLFPCTCVDAIFGVNNLCREYFISIAQEGAIICEILSYYRSSFNPFIFCTDWSLPFVVGISYYIVRG